LRYGDLTILIFHGSGQLGGGVMEVALEDTLNKRWRDGMLKMIAFIVIIFLYHR